MRRSLIYYWRLHLAVLLGAAVATAVLTGALLVGDSVRGSLRDLTLERLGRIDYAVLSERFVRENIADELHHDEDFQNQFDSAAPAILLNGNATHARSRARAARINIHGVDHRFASLFSETGDSLQIYLNKKSGQIFPSVVINASLQQELNAQVGDQILLNFEQPSDVHRESVLGDKRSIEVVRTLRLTVTKILPDRGLGRFGLLTQQTFPRNAFVPLSVLQEALEEEHKTNAMFIAQKTDSENASHEHVLRHVLRRTLSLEDLGLALAQTGGQLALTSPQLLIAPALQATIDSSIAEMRAPHLHLYTYLANGLTANGKSLPYSTITALPPPPEEFGVFHLIDGSPAPALAEDEIFLNDWAADDLQASPGDTVAVSYYVVGPGEQLVTRTTPFRMKGIIKIEGLAADPELTPEFPGIHEVDNMQAWDPPFPIDLKLIRAKDEAYWDEYRATPKAFIALATGQRLWQSRFGRLTAIRLTAAPGMDLQTTQNRLVKSLLNRIQPEQAGFAAQAVKAQGLAASSGATDFSGLFISFSFFLIVSATLLVGMLFRLGIEQRANELGLLRAVGFPQKSVTQRALQEAGVVAGLGCLLGLGGAIAYAGLLITGLRTWWVEAIGAAFLQLHVNPISLIAGYLLAMAIIALTIWLTLRQLRKIPAPALLHGVTTSEETKSGRLAPILFWAALGSAVVLLMVALLQNSMQSPVLFFACGALLLIAGLAGMSLWLRRQERRYRRILPITRLLEMGMRNTVRRPGRSMLSIALVACACFVIVAVGASRREFGAEVLLKNSGGGGFALVAESAVPLYQDLNTASGRSELGIAEKDSALAHLSQVIAMRLLPGEDASCLNLYRPQKPRILGVPPAQIERGGFAFQETLEGVAANPWRALELEAEPDVIPAIGDYNSVRWILHLGLGQDFVMKNEFGEEIRLRFVALLQSSIFQSEILISEENFVKHFPRQSGYSYFLLEAPFTQAQSLAQAVERDLSDYGFDAALTSEKLAGFQVVENTYLSVFQTLGGLGLLLGTLGLGIILLRNVIERRGELATLRAFGFREATLRHMLLFENGFLIFTGLVLGSLSALLAITPHLAASGAQVPWFSLALTLLAVFASGIFASLVAVHFSARIPLLPALKAE